MGRIDSAGKIEDFSKNFSTLRKDLDTAIGLNISNEVLDISASHTRTILVCP